MADYDPYRHRYPHGPVGALPDPSSEGTKFDGRSRSRAEEPQDAAAKDSVERMEATDHRSSPTGAVVELRHVPHRHHARGTGLAPMLGPGGLLRFADGHGRQLPKLEHGPFAYNQYAADALSKSIRYASKPMKQAVIAPSMLALLYPLKDPVEGYSREEFEAKLIDECEKDIRQAFGAGAARVSVDFIEDGWPPVRPAEPDGRGLLHFIERPTA